MREIKLIFLLFSLLGVCFGFTGCKADVKKVTKSVSKQAGKITGKIK